MIWIGSALVNSLFAMRDPVTTISSPSACASAGLADIAIAEAVAARNSWEGEPIFIILVRIDPPPGAAIPKPKAFQ